MAKMPWRLLLLLLAATATGRCNPTIAPNDLATLVALIRNKLDSQIKINGRLPMFSLAVNIPRGPGFDTYDPNRVNLDAVEKAVLDCEVHVNDNVVAATLLKWPYLMDYCPDSQVLWEDVVSNCRQVCAKKWPNSGHTEAKITWRYVQENCSNAVKDHAADHAEYRVLKKFQSWAEDKDKSGLLLFYVYASPCIDQCTVKNHARSILKLAQAITVWKKYAVVFSKVFKPKKELEDYPSERKLALQRLGESVGGLRNVFRCNWIKHMMVCQSCSSGGKVTRWCYDDSVQPSDSQTLPGRNERNRGKRSLGKRRGENHTSAVAPRVPSRVKATSTSQNGHFGQGEEATSDWEDMVPGSPAWGSVQERGEGQKQEGQRANEEGKKKRSQSPVPLQRGAG
ncbi:uncharacterized protein LOC144077129 [Stigmatopora argus]